MKKIFSNFEENIIAVGIIIMVVMETINVLCNKLMPQFSGIPQEIAIFVYIWVCFFCASYCTKKGANIIVDFITQKYNKKIQNLLHIVEYISDTILTLLFLYGSIIFIIATKENGAKAKYIGIPLWIIYLAPAFGFGFNLFRDLQLIVRFFNKK